MEKKSKLKTGFNLIILIVLLIALFMYVVILFNTITNKEVTLNFFRWKPFIVVSDSEEAGVNAGDMAIIKDTKLEDIKPGDIIVYRRGNNGAIKKVKDIKNTNGETKIVIEDDSVIKNESTNSSIEGKYMFKIAGLGNVMLFLQTPLGAFVLVSIFIYIVVIIKLIGSKSKKEELEEEFKETKEDINKEEMQNIQDNQTKENKVKEVQKIEEKPEKIEKNKKQDVVEENTKKEEKQKTTKNKTKTQTKKEIEEEK